MQEVVDRLEELMRDRSKRAKLPQTFPRLRDQRMISYEDYDDASYGVATVFLLHLHEDWFPRADRKGRTIGYIEFCRMVGYRPASIDLRHFYRNRTADKSKVNSLHINAGSRGGRILHGKAEDLP